MFGSFSVAQTGLNASKYGIEIVGNNIANQNTDGYKKRVSDLSEIGQIGGHITGRGVSFDGISRVTSQYLYDNYMKENTKTNYYDKLTSMLGNVEKVFAETDTAGLSVDLNKYFTAVEQLRSNPNSQIYKSNLQTQGEALVSNLQRLYSSVEQQQSIEKVELKENVKEVNSILKEIADINGKLENYTDSKNDLLDKRDALELKLSQYVNVDITRDNAYEIKIGGVTAVSNGTFNRELEISYKDTKQIDKFNYIQSNGTVLDSLKYNENGTAKAAYDPNDVIKYTLNNDDSLSVTIQIGEVVNGDWDNDPSTPDTGEAVTMDNLTRALAFKINNDPKLSQYVTARNGDYNDDYLVYPGDNRGLSTDSDKYLRVESNDAGKANEFTGTISIVRYDATNVVQEREALYKNESQSTKAQSDVVLKILEQNVNLSSGSIKAQVENLSSSSPNNKIQSYLDNLDSLATTLADIYDKYIQIGKSDYIYGENAANDYNGTPMGEIVSVGLFNGTSVKTLAFNKNAVNDLKQEQIDYLATIQWKTDLSFNGKGQNPNEARATSLTEYYRNTKVNVSSDTQNAKYSKEVQANIAQTIGTTYNKIVKVDKDEEMINLMQLQAAYSANAQMITAVNEMIKVILGLRS
ncbi:flagellar hook-associated protein FlgK [Aliarcobacter butzleri]|uniref:flagellar hook-associated protein FlgK n=1 Tax=Aliarcobacter butzleri TaxID=28197 RepID=UPI00125EC1CB|nr:flagellar hook-associated protein FlgK [Aliarcobacter butzleri]MCT7550554.1 flagellar hook-associated protein FlgK [Aliarcobacter butzleri]MCT7559616.1 flagellar hook-associated protein FlgK [Aliarcobacter butzleri]MCT7594977.1 flagellar hook-associated protein FlgK [Aliarcobacter butzleri]MCT7598219.1 flagellar hook-associated protein FlgK [Aliarcobacter butzleri]MCT7626250.1 flagellar hook-associated protein FlgK [Aliarcobacter butzleri]